MGEIHLLLLLACLLLLLLCIGAKPEKDLITPTYVFLDKSLSWREAQTFCREQYTDLITITNDKEAEKVSSAEGWIGLYRDQSTWKWSSGGEKATYTNWKEGDPGDDKDCAYTYPLNTKGAETEWISDSCTSTHSFFCSDERLVLVQEEKTWEEALEHCRSLEAVDPSKPPTSYRNHRYDLASLKTEEDHLFAREKAQEATTDEVWTGLRFLSGQWVWLGGEQVEYQDLPLCPAQWQHCGTLAKKGSRTWEMRDCMERRNFFCYKKETSSDIKET